MCIKLAKNTGSSIRLVDVLDTHLLSSISVKTTLPLIEWKINFVFLDWDVSNTYIQTTSASYEHLFWNATICRQLNNITIARDLVFITHNSALGFNVFGIWPENFDGPEVCSCDRSNSSKLIVTADDLGRLNLFSYPACQPKCLHHSYPGHSSYVACVRFLSDDSRIISIGGCDSSIMQWSVT